MVHSSHEILYTSVNLSHNYWCEALLHHDMSFSEIPNRMLLCLNMQGFPHSSVGKESTCNAGDLGSIPGLGTSTGEGVGHPLQYSWASLVAQTVKNTPAM